MSKTLTVNLEEFTDWSEEIDGVEIESRLALPEYVPTNRISVDVGRVATIARYARLESVAISGTSENETYSVSANNINGDGSATMGIVVASSVPRSKESLLPGEGDDVFPRGNSIIKVNVNHPSLKNHQLRQVAPWARQLDLGLKDGLKKSSKKQLLEPVNIRAACFLFSKSMDLTVGYGSYAITHQPKLIPAAMLYFAFGEGTGLFNRFNMVNGGKKDYENSFLRSLPYDRYFAVRALIHSRKIFKPIDQN